FDLSRALRERIELCSSLLRDVGQLADQGVFRPLHKQVYKIASATDAFHEMARAHHIGKIVIDLEDRRGARVAASSDAPVSIRADASYRITGGMGGLGLSAAAGLVDQGARHIVLVGRSGPSEAALQNVGAMQADGCRIQIFRADVSNAEEVRRVL